MKIQNFSSLPANDGTDRTIREANLQDKSHKYLEGARVRFTDDYTTNCTFVQDLYVFEQTRDCDGTPLYTLSLCHPKVLLRKLEVWKELGLSVNPVLPLAGVIERMLLSPGLRTGISEEHLSDILQPTNN